MGFGAAQLEVFAGLAARSAIVFALAVVLASFFNQAARALARGEPPFGFGLALPVALLVALTWPALTSRVAMTEALFRPGLILLGAMAAAYLSPLAWQGSPFRIRETVDRLAELKIAFLVLLVFAAGYALTVHDPRMPLFSFGDGDVFYYAKMARIALDPAANNLVGFDLLAQPAAHATPSAFLYLAGLSLATGSDAIDVLPVAIVLIATLAFLLARAICRRHFGLSDGFATAIALIWAVSGFASHLIGLFFLAQLIAIVIFLAILHLALSKTGDAATRALTLLLLFYLLAMTYPGMVPVYLAIHLFTVSADLALDKLLRRPGQPGRAIAALMSAPILGVILAAALDPGHAAETAGLVLRYSGSSEFGSPFDLINPLQLASGVAYPPDRGSLTAKLIGYAAIMLLVGAAAAASLWKDAGARRGADDDAGTAPPNIAGWLTLTILYCACLAGYLAYFGVLGPSYQQWKLAASAVFPLGFVPLAVLAKAALAFWPRRVSARWLAVPGAAVLAINLGAWKDQADRHRLSLARYAPLRQLQELEAQPGIAGVATYILDDTVGFKVAGQFLNRHKLRALDSPKALEPADEAGRTLVVTNMCALLVPPPSIQLGDAFCIASSGPLP